MDTGGARVQQMIKLKLCPFRKKRVAVPDAGAWDWEEQFQDCLQEKCAVWIGSCGFVANPLQPPQVEKDTKYNGNSGDLLEAIITVLEAKETKNNAIRAWCLFQETGNKGAVFAKNSVGDILQTSAGKGDVKIKYRRLQNNTLFAVFATKVDGDAKKN